METKQPQPGAAAEAQFSAPVDELAPVLELVKRYAKPVAIVAGTLLVIMAAYAGYDAWQSSKRANAVAEVGRILVTAEGQDRIQALETYLSDAPDYLRPALYMEIARAASDVGDNARAAETWKKLQELGDARLVPVAVLGQAQALAADGKPGEALAVMEAAAGVAPEGYKSAFALRIGVYAEAVGDWAKAMGAYQDIRSGTETDREFYDYKIAEFKAKLDEAAPSAPTQPAKDTNG